MYIHAAKSIFKGSAIKLYSFIREGGQYRILLEDNRMVVLWKRYFKNGWKIDLFLEEIQYKQIKKHSMVSGAIERDTENAF